MHDSTMNRRFNWQPLTLALLLVAAGITVFVRLLPPTVRDWNLAPAGAMFLFAGARSRSWILLLIPIATSLSLDLVFYTQHNWPVPVPSYLAFGLYFLLGRAVLRLSESPVAILFSTLVGTLGFFLITNTAFWIEMMVQSEMHIGQYYYCEPNLSGLLKCYQQAIEFSKGTFFGDLIFSAVFFGTFAWLSRTYFLDERVETA